MAARARAAEARRAAHARSRVCLLLYLNTRSLPKTVIVLLAVPFSAVGAVWFLYLLGYNMSIAVWVGLIALLGVDAETGVFMLLYLDLAYEEARREGPPAKSRRDLREAIVHGAAKRLRPKFMTVATMFLGLASHHVGHGHRVRRDEAHRRADGRRHLHLVPSRARRLSGDLRGLEVACPCENLEDGRGVRVRGAATERRYSGVMVDVKL